jgi:hypothetical protein
MTKKTRLFVFGATGVLVAGLGTGLLASYMGVGIKSLQVFSATGPAELAYLPQDAALIAYANVREVMDSDLRQKLLAIRPDSPTPDNNNSDPDAPDTPDAPDPDRNFEARTGISIERDVDTVVAAMTRSGENEHPLLVARGRFDEARIEGVVREQNGTVEDYRGVKLMIVPGDNDTMGVAFPEAGLAVVGRAEAVRKAIDTKQGASPDITTNAEVMNHVASMDDANAWAVGRFDAMARQGRLPSQLAGQLPPINWFSARGRINGGVEGVIQAEANTDEAAADLREVVRGFMALARLNTRQSAEITALLNSLQLGGDGRTVTVSFTIPAEVVDAFVALRQRREPPDQPVF